MTVAWSRGTGAEKCCPGDIFIGRFDALAAEGESYVEVRQLERAFPVLRVSIRDALAVVHLQRDPQTMMLLRGDGSVPGTDVVEVPVYDELAVFTGDFVMSAALARPVVWNLVFAGDVPEPEYWKCYNGDAGDRARGQGRAWVVRPLWRADDAGDRLRQQE